MRSFFMHLRVVSLLSVGAVALALTPPVQAADSGFYLGADVVSLQTTIDYGFTETYDTSHARLKFGYQILNSLSIEGRIMASSHDTDVYFLGDQYRFDTGTMVGVYARPHTNFRNANVYGIVGLTSMNTRYRRVAPGFGPADSDNVIVFTAGVGGTFRLVDNLTLDIEATIYTGTADYVNYFADAVDLYSVGLSAGLRYRF